MQRTILNTFLAIGTCAGLLCAAPGASQAQTAPAQGAAAEAPEAPAAPTAEEIAALPPVEEKIGYSYYLVQGPTLEVLDFVMRDKAPDNLAGANIWQVSYAPDPCTVSLSATISLPNLIGKSILSKEDLQIWDDMLIALEAYQKQHIAFGQSAASEVRGLNCTGNEDGGVEDVIARWREKGEALDLSTENGKTAGVTLAKPES